MTKATRLILLAALALASCRGTEHQHTPIHPNLNMDFQNRFDPQEANPFFEDNRSMRMLVPGTVARGMLREDVQFYEGRSADGTYIDQVPVPITRALLDRGQHRYDIFCTPCHGAAGDGEGVITTGGYGYTPAPTYHNDRMRQIADGYVYDVIANGVRTMPGYGHQVPVADRWAIVAYVRALQRSQYAPETDVPPGVRADIRPGAGATAAPADTVTDPSAQAQGDAPAADTTEQPAGDNE